ncbi:hypothetical protein Gogos_009800 [Gossypium gossypioides]|uniref:RNase H type-1 domain-containing protein n=1 Tax=Gossypium gossypioides TaxID=34282 RepID=A0A7J9BJ96_GOSGO|nr:hypothetical protein [Gossypium gossypioides]
MRFSYIELEGDSRSVIRKLSGKQLDRSSISAIIEDGKALPTWFEQSIFKLIPTEGNQSAHLFAKEGFASTRDMFYVEEVPELVQGVVESNWCGYIRL